MIVTVSPAATSATTADAFCLSSRIPAVLMCYMIAQRGRTAQAAGPMIESDHRAVYPILVDLRRLALPRLSGPVSHRLREGDPSTRCVR